MPGIATNATPAARAILANAFFPVDAAMDEHASRQLATAILKHIPKKLRELVDFEVGLQAGVFPILGALYFWWAIALSALPSKQALFWWIRRPWYHSGACLTMLCPGFRDLGMWMLWAV